MIQLLPQVQPRWTHLSPVHCSHLLSISFIFLFVFYLFEGEREPGRTEPAERGGAAGGRLMVCGIAAPVHSQLPSKPLQKRNPRTTTKKATRPRIRNYNIKDWHGTVSKVVLFDFVQWNKCFSRFHNHLNYALYAYICCLLMCIDQGASVVSLPCYSRSKCLFVARWWWTSITSSRQTSLLVTSQPLSRLLITLSPGGAHL